MKRLLAILIVSAPAYAGTLTISTTAPQEAVIEKERVFENAKTCTTLALPSSCTQAQARTAFCLLPGSSGAVPCTVNGVSSGTIRVYTDANDFGESLIKGWVFNARQSQDARELDAFATWRKAATVAQKNAVCAAAGFPNGCLP